MKRLNVSQICSINAIIKEYWTHYQYRKELKILGIIIRKGGFYNIYSLTGGDYITNETILKNSNLFIEDNQVFYYPHLEIYMSNQQRHIIFFNTVDHLNTYLTLENLKVNQWLDL